LNIPNNLRRNKNRLSFCVAIQSGLNSRPHKSGCYSIAFLYPPFSGAWSLLGERELIFGLRETVADGQHLVRDYKAKAAGIANRICQPFPILKLVQYTG
jgi:hypothetical protein